MFFLRQSTASQEVLIGTFVDSTDGNTPETALTIANTDIKLWKAGASSLVNKNSGGATHIASGNYVATLDATDTDTVGSGAIIVQMAGALTVRHNFTVLPSATFDAFISGSAGFPIRSVLKKNQALNNFTFLMTDSVNHNPVTGRVVSATRSIDGGAFAAGTLGSVSEISSGLYKISIPGADMNGDVVAVRFTATGADDLVVTFTLEP